MSAIAAANMVAESDDELMARVILRDHAAMRLAADRHATSAWRIAYRMLGDQTEAEDVAQESLLKLWNHADRWQAGGPGIGAWLSKVATNQCLDRLRRKRFKSDEEVPRTDRRNAAGRLANASRSNASGGKELHRGFTRTATRGGDNDLL